MAVDSLIQDEYVRAVDARLSSDEAYVEYQMQEAHRALAFLSRFVDLAGARVLEVGAGRGGKGMAYACVGIKVTSLDVDILALETGANIARARGIPVRYLVADGACLPFPAEHYDAVLLDSVIEHTSDPYGILKECARVLKPQGIVFVVFPPYWGPLSGHIDDYVMFPWFHLLPHGLVRRVLLSRPAVGAIARPEDVYTQYISLNRLSIRWFQRMARKTGLHVAYAHARPFLTHPGIRLVAGILRALKHPPRVRHLFQVLVTARKEFNVATGLLFVFLSAIAPLVYVPFLQEIAAGGYKCVLRK